MLLGYLIDNYLTSSDSSCQRQGANSTPIPTHTFTSSAHRYVFLRRKDSTYR